jgi:hypothetical protein
MSEHVLVQGVCQVALRESRHASHGIACMRVFSNPQILSETSATYYCWFYV